MSDAHMKEGERMDPISEADALLRGHARDVQGRFDNALEDTRSRIQAQVQDHPVRTVLVAVGAGVLVGLLLSLSRRSRREN